MGMDVECACLLCAGFQLAACLASEIVKRRPGATDGWYVTKLMGG